MAFPYQSPFSLFRYPMTGRDGNPYFVDSGMLAAANAAVALGRPLLLTGEPGCGKTDFAFAAASGLADGSDGVPRTPLEFYVRSDTSARDLLYRSDTVRRFSDAQSADQVARKRAQLPQNYITLEALGEAIISDVRRVVLVDEIDKAQRDLPNDLLRELDQARFAIPEIDLESDLRSAEADPAHQKLRRTMAAPAPASPRPLVIITSNVERQLPDAFLRRCLFYYMPFPSPKRLIDILNARFGEANATLHDQATALFQQLRDENPLAKKPATAELVDWVQCLVAVFAPDIAAEAVKQEANKKFAAGGPVAWASLPGISCLIKLREDLELLGIRPEQET
jgi:MoxR-like ATPase